MTNAFVAGMEVAGMEPQTPQISDRHLADDIACVRKFLRRLVNTQGELHEREIISFLHASLSGQLEPELLASVLTALRLRVETSEEIKIGARMLRTMATALDLGEDNLVDACGTGGDGAHTYNISTAAALVAAGAGIKIAKHAGRASSSQSGSLDVLGELGVNVTDDPEILRLALKTTNICILSAPHHHKVMRHVAAVRAKLPFPTLFNLLGPLSNPAGTKRQLLGVYDPKLLEPMAQALQDLGTKKAWIVHGNGLDELTNTGPNTILEWKDQQWRRWSLEVSELGLSQARPEDLKGGSAKDNARALTGILNGDKGPYYDVVCLNAAAILVIADKAGNLLEGLELARQSLNKGLARATLDRLILAQKGREA